MKLKFTRKTWYFFLLAAAAVSMLGGFAVLGGMDFSALELVAFCLTGIAALFLAAQKGAPARPKSATTRGVFVVLMLSKLAAGGWAGDICSALVWPALLGNGVRAAADPSSGSCSWCAPPRRCARCSGCSPAMRAWPGLPSGRTCCSCCWPVPAAGRR